MPQQIAIISSDSAHFQYLIFLRSVKFFINGTLKVFSRNLNFDTRKLRFCDELLQVNPSFNRKCNVLSQLFDTATQLSQIVFVYCLAWVILSKVNPVLILQKMLSSRLCSMLNETIQLSRMRQDLERLNVCPIKVRWLPLLSF